MKKIHSTFFFFLLSITLLLAQSPSELHVERKGENQIVSIKGNKIEIEINKKNGKKVLSRHYFPHYYGRNMGSPNKSKPIEADEIMYVPELGLVGFTLQSKEPRIYEKKEIKFNYSPHVKSYRYSETGKFVNEEMLFHLPGGNNEVGFVHWIFDIEKQKVKIASYETFIIRKKLHENGLTAEKTFYFEITANNPSKKLSKATAILYHGKSKVNSWDVENLRKVYAKIKKVDNPMTPIDGFILPSFILTDNKENQGYLQFGAIQADSSTSLVTINPDLEINNIRKNAYFLATAEDQPNYSYDVILPAIGVGTIFPYPGGRRDRNIISSLFRAMVPHPDMEGLYLPLDAKGEYILHSNSVGVMPITVKAESYAHSNSPHLLVRNWIIAYKQGKELLWGWASPEFRYFTPPIWKDWDLYEDAERTKNFRSFTLREGQFSTQINTVNGPILLAQLLNNSWQMFVQPNLIDFDGTFEEPNTYKGKIPKGATYEEAKKKGELWLYHANQKVYAEYSPIYKGIVAQIMKNAAVEFALSEKVRAAWEEYLEYIRNNPPPPRRYTTSASYAGLEPSFTNTLRNISSSGSSYRAIQSLQQATNQIRRATGKGY